VDMRPSSLVISKSFRISPGERTPGDVRQRTRSGLGNLTANVNSRLPDR
jgi:hypothetical protein